MRPLHFQSLAFTLLFALGIGTVSTLAESIAIKPAPSKPQAKKRKAQQAAPPRRGAVSNSFTAKKAPANGAVKAAGLKPLAVFNSTWNGGTGNWSTATDWTPNSVPNNGGGNTFKVTVDSGGTDTVSLDINSTISSLTVGGTTGSSTLQNKSGTAETLNVLGALTLNKTGTIEFGNASTLMVGGGLTNSGLLDLETGSKATITGSLTNSGTVATNNLGLGGAANTLTVNGTFTNNAGASFNVGNTSDVANVGTLINNGSTMINGTLNLTDQPNGITDVVAGSSFQLFGSLKAGAANGLAKLGSIEGNLFLANGQATTATPGTGTLTVSGTGGFSVDVGSTLTVAGNVTVNGTGRLGVDGGATVTVAGNLNNSGTVSTAPGLGGPTTSTLTVNGTFTNNAGGSFLLSTGSGTSASPDVANIGTLVNKGTITVGEDGTLHLSGGTHTNSGTIMLSGGGMMQGGAGLTLGGPAVTLGGNGTVTLNSANGSFIVGSTPGVILTTFNTIQEFGGTLGATIQNLGIVNKGIISSNGIGLTIIPNASGISNRGILEVRTASTFTISNAGGGGLTNFSGTTLTGGLYFVLGGTLRFPGANIVTNNADIVLEGSTAQIVDQDFNNALANFATNLGTFKLVNDSFTTAGNFTNNGGLVLAGTSKFVVNGNLTNFSGNTLTGGNYVIGGTLQFNGANIVSNAANITLLGGGTIINQSAMNAFRNFTNNTASGQLTLLKGQSLTTAGGSFTNAGMLSIGAGSTFTVGNGGVTSTPVNYTQTAGTTTVDGTLTSSASTTTPTLNLNGGSLFGRGTLGYSAVVDASGTITPGDSKTQTGRLTDTGTYAQNAPGILDISIGGTTAGTKYDQLNVTKTASLNGTLNISLVNGFVPTIGQNFTILNYSSKTGTFSTVNGLSINNMEHFTITYNATDVVLTVVSGAAAASASALSSALRPARMTSGLRGGFGVASLASSIRPVSMLRPASGAAFNLGAIARAPAGATFAAAPAAILATVGPRPGTASRGLSGLAVPHAAGFRSALNQSEVAPPRRLEYGVDVRALIHSPKQFAKTLFSQPGSAEAASLSYLVFNNGSTK